MKLAAVAAILGLAGVSAAQFQVVKTPNIVYTSASGFPQKLDLYQPTPVLSRTRGSIIFVHGGGWSGGDKSNFDSWCNYYAAKGYVCATINYRLAPQHVWPAQIDDTQAAVRWMRKNAAALFINRKTVVSVGSSAGGHLVQLLNLTDTLNDFDPALAGYSSRTQLCFDFFGPTDLTNNTEWAPNIWQLIMQFVGTPYFPGAPQYAAASPISYVNFNDPMMVLFHGDADATVPVTQSRRMDQKLTELGTSHIYYEFHNEGHGFTQPTLLFCIGVMDEMLRTVFRG